MAAVVFHPCFARETSQEAESGVPKRVTSLREQGLRILHVDEVVLGYWKNFLPREPSRFRTWLRGLQANTEHLIRPVATHHTLG